MDGIGTDLEQRAGVASLETLQHLRRLLNDRLAPLAAVYGPFGTADNRRKAFVEAVRVRVLADLVAKQEKATEKAVEAIAYSDAGYLAFLDKMDAEKVQYLTMALELTEYEEQIRNREFSMTCYSRELSLAR